MSDTSQHADRPRRRKPREEVSRNMAAIRSSGNRTEVSLRKCLHSMGLRYRTYVAGLPGRPDIVFPAAKVAVFVDGDYWHGRMLRERGIGYLEQSLPPDRHEYWIPKFQRNVERDDYVTSILRNQGWCVLRFWESDVRRDLKGIAGKIGSIVRARRD